MIIFTIGHSTRSIEEFTALLRREGVERVYDIRMYPGSRRHPQFNRDALAAHLRAEGITYEHHPELGGRRRAPRDAPPTAWRNEGFRGYAAYMRRPEFHNALDELIASSRDVTTAIMCSEAVPWRCHRTLVSDALMARGVEVRHIMDAKTSPHTLTSFAVVHDGEVSYPPEEAAQVELGFDRG